MANLWSDGQKLHIRLGILSGAFREAGFSDAVINDVMEQQYRLLNKLNVKYERIKY